MFYYILLGLGAVILGYVVFWRCYLFCLVSCGPQINLQRRIIMNDGNAKNCASKAEEAQRTESKLQAAREN